MRQRVKPKLEEIETPVPGLKHTSCSVCGINFKEGEYKNHIRGEYHAGKVQASHFLYVEIDAIIK